jgi:hypothetical protein
MPESDKLTLEIKITIDREEAKRRLAYCLPFAAELPTSRQALLKLLRNHLSCVVPDYTTLDPEENMDLMAEKFINRFIPELK